MGGKPSKNSGKNRSAQLPEVSKEPEEFKIQPVYNLEEHLKKNFPELEFRQIEVYSQAIEATANEAFSEHNRPKNRYTYVVPFDSTRVKLSVIAELEPGSDYINASWVKGLKNERAYIATQGPVPNSFREFWRMIWEFNVKAILMLTLIEERGRVKCHQYWPDKGDPQEYGDIKVSCEEVIEDSENSVTERKMRVVNISDGSTREISHFLYHGWPDHGVPSDTKGLRVLIRKVNEINGTDTDSNPLVVHCSAGIGRTGAFCTVHLTLDKMTEHLKEGNKEPFDFNLYDTVLDLRGQRTGMVQQPEQYRFCYEAIFDTAREIGLPVSVTHKPKPKTKGSEQNLSISSISSVNSGSRAVFQESNISEDSSKQNKKTKEQTVSETTEPNSDQSQQPAEKQVNEQGEERKKKKKKSKKIDADQSTPSSPGSLETSEGVSSPEKRKKKKKKHHHHREHHDSNGEQPENSQQSEEKKKKKKKKKHHHRSKDHQKKSDNNSVESPVDSPAVSPNKTEEVQ